MANLNMSADILDDAGVQRIPLDQLDPNPWQPRTREDAAHIQKLAMSILEQGLLQIPTARPHPTEPGRYQMAFGHSRLAAYRWLRDTGHAGVFDHFPVSIRPLTDRKMAEQAAHENIERKDLSAIEVGQAIGRLMADFKMTQGEAGAVYGYTNQASVSNLMRLLELPDAVRQLVHTEQLPERIARALVPLARFNAPAVAKMAIDLVRPEGTGEIGATEDGTPALSNYDNIETRAVNAIVEFYSKHGKQFDYKVSWDMAWPKKPLKVPGDIDVKGAPETVPACNGCPMRVKSRYNFYCMNPACFKTKGLLKAREAVKASVKKLSIPAATVGEKFTVIYKGEGAHNDATLKAILESGHESLRLVPYTTHDYQGFNREKALGNDLVALATVDEAALKLAVKGYATTDEVKKTKAAPAIHHGWKAEQAAREVRGNRMRMIQRAAVPFFARVMPDNAAVLKAIIDATDGDAWFDGYNTDERLEMVFAGAVLAEQQRIVAGVLLWSWVSDYRYNEERTPAEYADHIDSLQAGFGVRLPATWAVEALNAPVPDKADQDWRPKDAHDRDEADDEDAEGDDEGFDDEVELTELGAEAVAA